MKRREFANLAVAGLAVAGGSLVSGAPHAQMVTPGSGGGLRKDSYFFMSGASRISDAGEKFDIDGISPKRLADYAASGVSLMAFYKDGTGVALGVSSSMLVRGWNGAPETPYTEYARFGYLFTYLLEKNGTVSLSVTQDSYKTLILSGPRKGLLSVANSVNTGSYFKGMISEGKYLRLYTHGPQQVMVSQESAKYKLKSKRIYGDAVPKNFLPNLPDFQVTPDGLMEAYKTLLA